MYFLIYNLNCFHEDSSQNFKSIIDSGLRNRETVYFQKINLKSNYSFDPFQLLTNIRYLY